MNTEFSKETLLKIYEMMFKIRRFEEKVSDLVSVGEIKTPCHLYIGQEAVSTGACFALDKKDYIFGTHRSHGCYLAKGGDPKKMMAELYGKETGCSRGKGGSMHLIDVENGLLGTSAIVSGNISLGTGVALASSFKNDKSVTLSFFGDGATAEGLFYESLNFASLMKLPVIFLCENNLYSTHMPIAECLVNTNIAEKAEIFKMQHYQIDGNNVLEVFETVKKAADNARRGGGPTLIECITYRWRGHVGPNDDLEKGLRSKEELEYWMKRCPIKNFEKVLTEKGILSEEEKKKIQEKIEKEIEESVAFAKNSPYPKAEELTKGVFK